MKQATTILLLLCGLAHVAYSQSQPDRGYWMRNAKSNPSEAVKSYSNILASNPHDAEVLFLRAQAYYTEADKDFLTDSLFALSIADYDQLISLDSSQEKYWYNKSLTELQFVKNCYRDVPNGVDPRGYQSISKEKARQLLKDSQRCLEKSYSIAQAKGNKSYNDLQREEGRITKTALEAKLLE